MLRYLKTILREYLSTLPHPPPTANIVCCGRPHLDDHHDLAKEGRKEVRGALQTRLGRHITYYLTVGLFTFYFISGNGPRQVVQIVYFLFQFTS
jgi:hypothetical protein